MISLKSILYSVTKVLAENFKQDIFIEDNNAGGFNNSCFFVQLLPLSSEASTKVLNFRSIIVSVKYLQQSSESIVNIHDVNDKLELIFGRTLQVGDRIITISETESNMLTDEVGRILDFMIHLDFHDEQYSEYGKQEEYELMLELYANVEGKTIKEGVDE